MMTDGIKFIFLALRRKWLGPNVTQKYVPTIQFHREKKDLTTSLQWYYSGKSKEAIKGKQNPTTAPTKVCTYVLGTLRPHQVVSYFFFFEYETLFILCRRHCKKQQH